MEKLKSWPKLESLHLSNNGIESETMTRLATFSLVNLVLGGDQGIVDELLFSS